MTVRSAVTVQPGDFYELQALEALPCGCVVSVSRARVLDLAVVRLEAKGPFCRIAAHAIGALVSPDEVEGSGETGAAWEDDTAEF